MVLLARRALQERFATKQRDGGGDGIEAGSRIRVLSGRHFPLFAAGDEGEVIHVDHEAQNCDVLFDGATHKVPVALRHLGLARGSAALRQPSRPHRHAWHDGSAGSPARGPEVAAAYDGSPCRSPSVALARRAPRTFTSPEDDAEAQRQVFVRLREAMAACEAALDARGVPAERGGAGCSTAAMPLDHAAASPQMEALEARIRHLEERHQAEVLQLRGRIDDALSFGRQQQARAQSLEEYIRGRVGGSVALAAGPGSASTLAAHAAPIPAPPVWAAEPPSSAGPPQKGSWFAARRSASVSAPASGAGMAADSLRGVVVAPGLPSGALTARAHHSPPARPPGVAPACVPWAPGATADRLSASCGGSSGRATPRTQASAAPTQAPAAAGAGRRAASCATLRPTPRWCAAPQPGVPQQPTMFLVARPQGPHLCAAPAATPPAAPTVAPQAPGRPPGCGGGGCRPQ